MRLTTNYLLAENNSLFSRRSATLRLETLVGRTNTYPYPTLAKMAKHGTRASRAKMIVYLHCRNLVADNPWMSVTSTMAKIEAHSVIFFYSVPRKLMIRLSTSRGEHPWHLTVLIWNRNFQTRSSGRVG